jgi:hypothetical protein
MGLPVADPSKSVFVDQPGGTIGFNPETVGPNTQWGRDLYKSIAEHPSSQATQFAPVGLPQPYHAGRELLSLGSPPLRHLFGSHPYNIVSNGVMLNPDNSRSVVRNINDVWDFRLDKSDRVELFNYLRNFAATRPHKWPQLWKSLPTGDPYYTPGAAYATDSATVGDRFKEFGKRTAVELLLKGPSAPVFNQNFKLTYAPSGGRPTRVELQPAD